MTQAAFKLTPGDGAAAVARVKELNTKRWASLPSGKPNCGSVFRNPEGDYAGRLIEHCGLKGARCGGAQISEKHANVIINNKDARAEEVLALMIYAARSVSERCGVRLEPEVVLAGNLKQRFWAGVLAV